MRLRHAADVESSPCVRSSLVVRDIRVVGRVAWKGARDDPHLGIPHGLLVRPCDDHAVEGNPWREDEQESSLCGGLDGAAVECIACEALRVRTRAQGPARDLLEPCRSGGVGHRDAGLVLTLDVEGHARTGDRRTAERAHLHLDNAPRLRGTRLVRPRQIGFRSRARRRGLPSECPRRERRRRGTHLADTGRPAAVGRLRGPAHEARRGRTTAPPRRRGRSQRAQRASSGDSFVRLRRCARSLRPRPAPIDPCAAPGGGGVPAAIPRR